MFKNFYKKIKSLNYKDVLKFLRFTSTVAEKLPNKEDTFLTGGVKSLALLHYVQETFVGKPSIIKDLKDKYNLVICNSQAIVDLIFNSKFLDKYELKRYALSENNELIEVVISDTMRLVFNEFSYEGLQREAQFYHTEGFDFKLLMENLWLEYCNGIYLENNEGFIEKSIFMPLPDSKNENLSPIAIERINKYANFTMVKCYLALGKPGTGKSRFAKALAEKKSNRLLKIDASSVASFTTEELDIIITSLSPNIVIIDDFDRVNFYGSSGKLLFLLEVLHSHSSCITVLTANNIDSIDPALLRAGRVDEIIDFELPDEEERKWIILNNSSLKEMDVEYLTKQTDGFSQAEIINLLSMIEQRSINEALKVAQRLHKVASDSKFEAFPTVGKALKRGKNISKTNKRPE